jgi:hypothetical protein
MAGVGMALGIIVAGRMDRFMAPREAKLPPAPPEPSDPPEPTESPTAPSAPKEEQS